MVDKNSKLAEKFAANLSAAGGAAMAGGGGTGMSALSAAGGGGGGGGSGGGGMSSGTSNSNALKSVQPMNLFATWEVDRTPPNCIPRFCSVKITRLSILAPLPGDTTSLQLAVKMQSSKRILRSHEIPINVITGGWTQPTTTSTSSTATSINLLQQSNNSSTTTGVGVGVVGGAGGAGGVGGGCSGSGVIVCGSGTSGGGGGSGSVINNATTGGNILVSAAALPAPLLEIELDLHISLQYPHFIKRDGNRLVILLQRRKKYKSRTILGYKTLAEGIIRMDAVLQKSMDMIIELTAPGKHERVGTTVACLRAERVSSIPVDHDNKNNNNVTLADRVAEYSDEDEEAEFSSGEFNDDVVVGNERDYNAGKHEIRKYRKLQRSEVDDVALGADQQPVDSDSEFELKDKISSRAKISRQRNFKQKFLGILKRFKVSEELEGDVSRGRAALRGERDLDALFQELESLSCCEGDDSGPDMDSISIGSTPKPSLRPFFTNSRIMLHESSAGLYDRCLDNRNDSSGNEYNAANTDGQASDTQNNSPPRNTEKDKTRAAAAATNSGTGGVGNAANTTSASGEKRSRLFRTSSNTPNNSTKKKQTLNISADIRSGLEACLSPTNVEPRKLLLDQLSRVFASDDNALPEVVTIISPPEALSGSNSFPRLIGLFASTFRPAFVPQNTAEVKAVLQALMVKVQKYCNSNAKPPNTIKILMIGGDWLQGAILRHYVELMGVRPPDWLHHLRFYLIPMGSTSSGCVARYLSQMDQTYAAMFGSDNWQQLCERAAVTAAAMSAVTVSTLSTTLMDSANASKSDMAELVQRINCYLNAAGPCTQIPIAEAMVNYKDEDSCQIFVPFISDVRIGYTECPQMSVDIDEYIGYNSPMALQQGISGSPPHHQSSSGRMSPPVQTPPAISSPFYRGNETATVSTPGQKQGDGTNAESVELQVDYWTIVRPSDTHTKESKSSTSRSSDQSGKNSIKSAFRNLQVWRLPQHQLGDMSNGLTLSYATKEKKQKQIMRLGKKKEKDRDGEKEQIVECIARLICSTKQSHQMPLRVYIDGTEWTGVKFFQLSSQWQTHVKNFPMALIGCKPSSVST